MTSLAEPVEEWHEFTLGIGLVLPQIHCSESHTPKRAIPAKSVADTIKRTFSFSMFTSRAKPATLTKTVPSAAPDNALANSAVDLFL